MNEHIVERIRRSGLTIYDSLDGTPDLFIDQPLLESILNKALLGFDLSFPLRTRSKVIKAKICDALGYPIPSAFQKTQPRFPGQNFDTYVQKANNLQIWNEEVSASRRYVLIRIDEHNLVTKVRVVDGSVLARLDTTGTLTHKYQARSRQQVAASHLVSPTDTANAQKHCLSPSSRCWPGFLTVSAVFERVAKLVGTTIPNAGLDQERNRGGALHNLVSAAMGISSWSDNGQFPDIVPQLLEVKLQTSPTIDLGLVCPDDTSPMAGHPNLRHCDVRYVAFYATPVSHGVRLDHVIVTTGELFFTYFQRFEGRVRNAKLQIPLPSGFFD